MVTLKFGTPIGAIWLSSEVTRYRWEQTGVSVGPYSFHNSPQRGRSWFAKSGESASPPQKSFSPRTPSHPDSSSMRQVAGVALIASDRKSTLLNSSHLGI